MEAESYRRSANGVVGLNVWNCDVVGSISEKRSGMWDREEVVELYDEVNGLRVMKPRC